MRARITLVVGGNRNVVSLGLETTTTGHVASIEAAPRTFTVDSANIIITIVTVLSFQSTIIFRAL
jgi:hypothetical protein